MMDGIGSPIAMTPGTTASAAGQFLYTGAAMVPPGQHAFNIVVTMGLTAAGLPNSASATPVSVTTAPNQPPVVNAGLDTSVILPAAVSLTGTVTDDTSRLAIGISPDGASVPPLPSLTDNTMAVWTLGGTGPNQMLLMNGVQAAGGFGSKLMAYQGTVYVIGDDAVLAWYRWTGTTWALFGPTAPTTLIPSILTVQWSMTSGPGVVTFQTPTQLATTASFSVPGIYVLRLTASDSQLTAFDEVTVTAVNLVQAIVVQSLSHCQLLVSAVPPDSSQWTVKFFYGLKTPPTSPMGATAKSYQASVSNLAAGTYQVVARWTSRAGAVVTTPAQTVICR